MKKLLIYSSILIILAIFLYSVIDAVLNPEIHQKDLDYVSQKVKFTKLPEFSLLDLNYQVVTSQDLPAKLILVHFWASWCSPCRVEFPSLLKFAKQFHQSVQVIAISLDQSRSDMQDFLNKMGEIPDNFKVLWDSDGKVSKLFGTNKLPESYLFGSDKSFVKKIAGDRNWTHPQSIKEMEQIISH